MFQKVWPTFEVTVNCVPWHCILQRPQRPTVERRNARGRTETQGSIKHVTRTRYTLCMDNTVHALEFYNVDLLNTLRSSGLCTYNINKLKLITFRICVSIVLFETFVIFGLNRVKFNYNFNQFKPQSLDHKEETSTQEESWTYSYTYRFIELL